MRRYRKEKGFASKVLEDMKKAMGYFRAARPYLLSHHPICEPYSKDVLHVGSSRLCWGCIVTYPTAVAVLSLLVLTGLFRSFPWPVWFLLGVVFGSAELLNLREKRSGALHRMINLCLGTGMALMTLGIFMMPVFICFRLYIFFTLYLIAGLLISFRVKNLERRCRKCSWRKDWDRCPGFRDLHTRLRKEGLE